MSEYGTQGQQQQQWSQTQNVPPSYPGQQQGGWAPQQAPSGPYVPGQVPQQPYGGHVVIQQQPAPQTVVVVGGCPTCRVGHLDDEFTCLGILCCILFFPLGLICLFTMKEKRCTNCGTTFG